MATYLHETAIGEKIEYRRVQCAAPVLWLESRVLRTDGTPFDDRWYRVGDRELLDLQLDGGRDIVALMAAE